MLTIRKKHAFVAKEKGSPVLAVIASTRAKASKTMDSLVNGIRLSHHEKVATEFRFYRACGLSVKQAYYKALEACGERYGTSN